jgi:hypothetical protein
MGDWDCRAGMSGGLIRSDGTLSPCFEMINYNHDWGHIWASNFSYEALTTLNEGVAPVLIDLLSYHG